MPTDLRVALSEAFGTRFRVDRELGRGGMATVYLVHDARHGRDVALKVLHPELAATLGRDRFLREIAFAARLTHPNILPLYESGEAGSALFYLMPYVEGDTLRKRLGRDGPLPLADALRIARDVANALAHAHGHNVLHRDIKPGNILLQGNAAVVADFGIARAVSRAADDITLTDSGLLIGTPAYMAPELGGSREPDGRADVYALGCVLYEMLAGDPPFTGSSTRVVLARHALDAVPPLRTARGELPAEVESLVMRALAKVPADRWPDAASMADELESLVAGTALPRVSAATVAPVRRRRTIPAALGITLAAGAAVWLGSAALGRGNPAGVPAEADTTRIAVFPVEAAGSLGATTGLDQSMHDAVSRWDGISTVGQADLRDVVAPWRGRRPSMAQARDAALALGAGRYVRGELSGAGDGSYRLHAALYSTASNALLADATARLGRDLAGADSILARTAEGMLLREPAMLFRPGADSGSTNLPARQAFRRGLAAVEQWDLDAADSGFSVAQRADPQYAAADLWLALVRSWAGAPLTDWRSAAERAVASRGRLPSSDQPLADAVQARARGDLVGACRAWDQLTRQQPEDFVAWYGSADCQHADSIVLRDPAARTGWRFRTSFHSAIGAFQHAFLLLPSALNGLQSGSFRGLRRLFGTSGSELRAGYGEPGDGARFAAYPAWRGDTLAFEPVPLRDVMQLKPGATPDKASRAAALRHQRALFFDVARAWRAAEPRNSAAIEALAIALDLLRDRSALDTLQKARRLAATPSQRTHLAVMEVFLRLRRALPLDTSGIHRARRLADSILASDVPRDAATAMPLMSAAALTGRAAAVGRLSRLPGASADWQVPRPLDGLAFPLLMFSALGGPVDSLAPLEAAVESAIVTDVPQEERNVQRLGWLGRSATLAFAVHRSAAIASLAGRGDPLVDALAAYARGETSSAASLIASVGRAHDFVDPADVSLEGLLPEAWLLWRLGRADAAVARLDPTLQGLLRTAPDLIASPVEAAALVRAMMLRAQLADQLGDRRTAIAWARAARILWSDADPFAAPALHDMEQCITNRCDR